MNNENERKEDAERQAMLQELEHLIACYQIASRDDKNVVWAALNKYMPSLSL
ncbi:MAG: hypothetical protein LIO54_09530 [Oscillospiraceae bacterium]|nr:hypothetical protein [Oscillospiraceae bacterium]